MQNRMLGTDLGLSDEKLLTAGISGDISHQEMKFAEKYIRDLYQVLKVII